MTTSGPIGGIAGSRIGQRCFSVRICAFQLERRRLQRFAGSSPVRICWKPRRRWRSGSSAARRGSAEAWRAAACGCRRRWPCAWASSSTVTVPFCRSLPPPPPMRAAGRRPHLDEDVGDLGLTVEQRGDGLGGAFHVLDGRAGRALDARHTGSPGRRPAGSRSGSSGTSTSEPKKITPPTIEATMRWSSAHSSAQR